MDRTKKCREPMTRHHHKQNKKGVEVHILRQKYRNKTMRKKKRNKKISETGEIVWRRKLIRKRN